MILTDGSNSVTLPAPSFGYRTEVIMPLVYSRRADGSYGIKDLGSSYDRRICKGLRFVLSDAEMASLVTLLGGTANGRGEDLELQLGASATGFFPFGPDKGDMNTFTVRAEIKEGGLSVIPFKRFEPELILYYLSGPSVAYSITDTVSDGTLQIGTITGIGYPQEGYPAKVGYALTGGYLSGATAEELDLGAGADSYETRPTLYGRYSKMGALVNYLVGTARASNISVTFPSYSYPFGSAKGASGAMTVQPLYSRIDDGAEIASIDLDHYAHNYFSMPFGMRWVS